MDHGIKCKLIFCDDVRNDPTSNGVQNSLVGVMQAIEPVNIPGNFTFTVACFLSGMDVAKSNTLRANLIDPNGNCTTAFDNITLPAMKPIEPECEYLNAQINLEFRNTVLSVEGEYTVEVYINEELVASDTINVIKRRD